MKNTKIVLGLAVIAIGFASCKDEKTEQAEKKIDSYVTYVDSLGNVAEAEAEGNWKAIESSYDLRVLEAEAAIADIKDNTKAQAKLDASRAKYEALKIKMEAKRIAAEPSPKQKMRNSLFGAGKIGDDMNFNWVDAANIHGVYQQFVHTVENNKDKYSREDWDEIKVLYEALDTRKNMVEKEGLKSADNLKIAALKVKFAAIKSTHRGVSKITENTEAKQ